MKENRLTSRRGVELWLTPKLQMSSIGRSYVGSDVHGTFWHDSKMYSATETQFGNLGAAIYAIYYGSTHLQNADEAFCEWMARDPQEVEQPMPSKPVDSEFPIKSTSEQAVLNDVRTVEASIRRLITHEHELCVRLVYLRTALQMIADGPNAGMCLNAEGMAQHAQDALRWLNDREVKGGE